MDHILVELDKHIYSSIEGTSRVLGACPMALRSARRRKVCRLCIRPKGVRVKDLLNAFHGFVLLLGNAGAAREIQGLTVPEGVRQLWLGGLHRCLNLLCVVTRTTIERRVEKRIMDRWHDQ